MTGVLRLKKILKKRISKKFLVIIDELYEV